MSPGEPSETRVVIGQLLHPPLSRLEHGVEATEGSAALRWLYPAPQRHRRTQIFVNFIYIYQPID